MYTAMREWNVPKINWKWPAPSSSSTIIPTTIPITNGKIIANTSKKVVTFVILSQPDIWKYPAKIPAPITGKRIWTKSNGVCLLLSHSTWKHLIILLNIKEPPAL